MQVETLSYVKNAAPVAWGTLWLDLRMERDGEGGQLDKTSKFCGGQLEERDHEEDALSSDVEQAVVTEKTPAHVLSGASAYQMKLRRLRRFRRFRRLLEEYDLGIQSLCSTSGL